MDRPTIGQRLDHGRALDLLNYVNQPRDLDDQLPADERLCILVEALVRAVLATIPADAEAAAVVDPAPGPREAAE